MNSNREEILNDFEKLLKKSSEISEEIRKHGNNLFCQKRHDKALHLGVLRVYSKSIAFAPEYSESLAAAYSNRSVLLEHIGRIEEAIADIDKALQISKSKKLLLKLTTRKAKIVISNEKLMKSLNLIDNTQHSSEKENDNETFNFPSITKPSSMMPCTSESVLLKYNQTWGRHFIAGQDINPGEVIIVEDGYICFPNNSVRYIVCSHCLQFAWNSIPCSNCSFVVYCSEECKKKAWQDYHDLECRIYPYCKFLLSDQNTFHVGNIPIILRIFFKAVKNEGLDSVLNDVETINTERDNEIKGLLTNGVLQNDKFRSFYNLSSNTQYTAQIQEISDYNIKKLITLLLTKTDLLDAKKISQNTVSIELINQLKIILHKIGEIADANVFSYQGSICACLDSDFICTCASKRGLIITPCCSLVNHSCSPNLSRMFLPKKKMIMFTITQVKKGDQLCDSYGPSIVMTKNDRQQLLKQSFFFNCMCKPCTENWPQLAMLLLTTKKTEMNIKCQVIYEFKKSYPKENELFIFQKPEDVWGISEEGLEKAKLITKLIFKYSNDSMETFILSYPYRYYIDKILFTLYGEKCVIPDVCVE
ncbi:SET and MYND domain-containing protein 4-like isoform X2 [Phymastichus coffea]|nr:SET and MYND domain-containing protein 4-like isoform X2 [Phymastichus coffea]XP_058794998.1 SET and MYND domain-containing protein 4-like isoform X2 [Phymastichus coffea]